MQTNEVRKLAEQFLKARYPKLELGLDGRIEDLVAFASHLQPEAGTDGWISVDERLPEINATVLAWKPERWAKPFEIVRYSQESDKHRNFIRRDGQWWDSGCRITHWRGLPAAPGSERKEKA